MSSPFLASDNDDFDFTFNVQDCSGVPTSFPNNIENLNSAQFNSSPVLTSPSIQCWDLLIAPRRPGSDSGSDCQSIRSCFSSPSSSPLQLPCEGPELASSIAQLSLDAENQPNHGRSPIPSPLILAQSWNNFPFQAEGLLPIASPTRSDSSENSLYYSPSPAFVYPLSPGSPSIHSQSPGHTSQYSPLPGSPQSPSFNGNSSAHSPSFYSPHHPQSPSFHSSPSDHSPDPQNCFNSSHIQSLAIPSSGYYNAGPGTPFSDSSYSPSGSSDDILPSTPFERLQHTRPYYESQLVCNQEPIASPNSRLASTSSDILLEIIECVDGNSSSRDATEIKRQVMSTLRLSGDDQTAKRLFGKPAKNSVSTPAGRKASQKRRIHPAKWNCPICGDNFTRNAGLKNHLKSHVGVTDYECRHCHNVFNTSLGRHEERCSLNPGKDKAPRKKTTTQKTTADEFHVLETCPLDRPPLY